MDALGNGLIILVNGLIVMGQHLMSLTAMCLLLIAFSLAWYARLEIDELNRQGIKPTVGLH